MDEFPLITRLMENETMELSLESRRETSETVRELSAAVKVYSKCRDNPDEKWIFVLSKRLTTLARKLCALERQLNPEQRAFGHHARGEFSASTGVLSALDRIREAVDILIQTLGLEPKIVSVGFRVEEQSGGEKCVSQVRNIEVDAVVAHVRELFADEEWSLPTIDPSLAEDLELAALDLVTSSPVALNGPQKRILKVLDGKALTKDSLTVAAKVDNMSGSKLYKLLGELQAAGLVAHKQNLGYYRPDALPPGLPSD